MSHDFRRWRFAALLVLGLSPVAPCHAADATVSGATEKIGDRALTVSAARLNARGTQVKLELDFDAKPNFRLHYVDTPPRLILDFPRTLFTLPDKAVPPQGLVTSVRYGTMGEGQARLVLALSHPVKVVRLVAEPFQKGVGSHLILEGEKVSTADYRTLLSTQTWDDPAPAFKAGDTPPPDAAPTAGPFLVAVDAGHGGIDTGATGSDGTTLEKDITLAFARALVENLNAEPGIHAFLTRGKDEFLSLSERVQIARDRKASLFISFHADTLNEDGIRGATVYTISDKASDSLAASIAERENLSDEIAGLKFAAEPEEVADILLDLTRRETQAFSVTFAQQVIQSFKGEVELINNPQRSAGFRVLRAPEIPSILLELGFLSNEKDEALLLSDPWRQKIASLLTAAVVAYHKAPSVTATGNGP
nr:N-acetylmuramoyl-L-alanine amidase [uncultured Gellertiella sp.]